MPLTDGEQRVLLAKRKHSLTSASVKAIASVLVLAPLLLFHTIMWLVALPVFSLALAIGALGSFIGFCNLKKDLGEGQKSLIAGRIDDQNVDVTRHTDRDGVESSATYNFWIKVEGRKFTVSEDQYYRLKRGDQIEVQVAPHSQTVFGINKYSE